MLIQFNFKNFRSFKNETSLDMTATKISEHPLHIIKQGGEKLLPVAAIYGANASGKSNVYEAFSFMKTYVINSFYYGGNKDRKNNKSTEITPYLFDKESRNKPSEFEIFYIDNSDKKEKTYQYGFSILGSEIIEEWLYSKAKSSRKKYKTIFYRKKGAELEIEGLPKKAVENLKIALQDETLIVSLGTILNIKKLSTIYDWFVRIETVHLDYLNEEFSKEKDLPSGFADSKKIQKDVLNFISSFDKSIVDFKIEKIKQVNENIVGKSYMVHTVHKLPNSKETQSIPLANESSGTKKMLALYAPLKYVLNHGGLIFIDELNDKLHPLLVRNIILCFLLPEININHAQLLLTSHDIWQFSNDLLRRDELWITDKNQEGVSSLYSIAEFKDYEGNKIRKNEALSKNYLVGNYGGIPILKPLAMLKGDINEK